MPVAHFCLLEITSIPIEFGHVFEYPFGHSIIVEKMSVARSLIYRYLAYSMEMKKEEDQAEEYYRMAADIAIQNDNDAVAERVFKDMAEFNWNRGNFEQAYSSLSLERT